MLIAVLFTIAGHRSDLDVHRQLNGQKVVVHIYKGYYSAIKRNAFESIEQEPRAYYTK